MLYGLFCRKSQDRFLDFSAVMFDQMAKKLQSQVVEECKESYIEILSTGPLLADATETDPLTSFRAPTFEASLARLPIQADYCPQSALVPARGPARPVRAAAINGYLSQKNDFSGVGAAKPDATC